MVVLTTHLEELGESERVVLTTQLEELGESERVVLTAELEDLGEGWTGSVNRRIRRAGWRLNG